MKQHIDYDGMADQGRVPVSQDKKSNRASIWGGLALLLVFVLFILALTF
ncbi:MAG: hypothetical protein ACON47_10290 [Flavobacteriaceae bacterium]